MEEPEELEHLHQACGMQNSTGHVVEGRDGGASLVGDAHGDHVGGMEGDVAHESTLDSVQMEVEEIGEAMAARGSSRNDRDNLDQEVTLGVHMRMDACSVVEAPTFHIDAVHCGNR